MAIVSPDSQFVKELLRILELPEHVVSFELRCAVDEAVTVRCVYYPDIENSSATRVLEEKLHYKEKPWDGNVAADGVKEFSEALEMELIFGRSQLKTL